MMNELKEEEAFLIADMKTDLSKTLLDFRHRWNLSPYMVIRLIESATKDYWLVFEYLKEYRPKSGKHKP